MKLYEYDAAIDKVFDAETGEILDYEAYKMLEMEKDKKISNTALKVKDMKKRIEALKEISNEYSKKAEVLENEMERLKGYLALFLEGEKFKNDDVSIYYNVSTSTEIEEGTLLPEKYLTIKAPEYNKKAIKEALVGGEVLVGCKLVEKKSLVIR